MEVKAKQLGKLIESRCKYCTYFTRRQAMHRGDPPLELLCNKLEHITKITRIHGPGMRVYASIEKLIEDGTIITVDDTPVCTKLELTPFSAMAVIYELSRRVPALENLFTNKTPPGIEPIERIVISGKIEEGPVDKGGVGDEPTTPRPLWTPKPTGRK